MLFLTNYDLLTFQLSWYYHYWRSAFE